MQLQTVVSDRAQIVLLFYKPTATDPFINRLVSFFDPPYSHVEMAFPERYGDELWDKIIWGTSIFQDEPVFFKKRSYQRDGYVSIALEVSLAQQLCVRRYCREQAAASVPFDKVGMYLAYFPVQLWQGQGTFCSKHITQALQHGGIIPPYGNGGLNAALSTPSTLHKHIVNSNTKPIVHGIPARMANGDVAKWSGVMSRDLVRSLVPYNNEPGGAFGGALLLKREEVKRQSKKLGDHIIRMIKGKKDGVGFAHEEDKNAIINDIV